MPAPITPEDRAEADAALARLEQAAAFRASRQSRELLRFLVAQCLAGEAARIKGYTIGVEVLRRPAEFDPAVDTGVRVAMRRLRRLLAEHYAGPGAAETVRFHLDPGDYAPRLLRLAGPEPAAEAPPAPPAPDTPGAAPAPQPEAAPARPGRLRRAVVAGALAACVLGVAILAWRQGADTPAQAAMQELRGPDGLVQRQPAPTLLPLAAAATLAAPVLLVQPIVPVTPGQAALAEAVGAELRIGLARFTELAVLDAALPAAEAASPAPSHRVLGSLHPGGRLVVELREQATGRVLAVFEGEAHPPSGTVAARFIATAIAQPYGVVLSAWRLRGGQGPPQPGFGCVLALFEYWRHYDPARFPAIARCLAETEPVGPAAAAIRAAQVLGVLEAFRIDPARPPAVLARAYALARAAVQDHPYDPRVQQALAAVLYARGDAALALGALRNARRYNPHDPDIAADLASRLLGMGEVAEARGLLREACYFVAARPAWMDFYIFLAELLAGNVEGAVDRAGRMTDQGFELNLVARVIAARLAGDAAGQARWRTALEAGDPAWRTDPARLLRQRLPSERVVQEVLARFSGEAPVADSFVVAPRASGRLTCAADAAT